MHDQSHGPIEVLVLGESAVAAFVGENPDAGEDEALDGGICYPGCEAKILIGEEMDVVYGQVDEGGCVEGIAYDVGHAAEDGGFEAVGGDGIVDFLHGEMGEFEGVAIEIEMLGFWLCHGGGGW